MIHSYPSVKYDCCTLMINLNINIVLLTGLKDRTNNLLAWLFNTRLQAISPTPKYTSLRNKRLIEDKIGYIFTFRQTILSNMFGLEILF